MFIHNRRIANKSDAKGADVMSNKTKSMRKGKYFDEKKWEQVNPDNKYFMNEFLDNKRELSPASLRQYQTSLQIFFLWVLEHARNTFFVELKKRDVLKYQNWLIDQGINSNTIKFRKSAVSSLCNYMTTYYDEEYPTFRNIVTGVESPQGEKVHKKEPLTLDELELLRKTLAEKEMWQQLAFLEIAYSTGGRRAEIGQLKKEIVDYEKNEKGFYNTHDVRAKGKGITGKIRQLSFSEEAKDAIAKWLEVRGEDECEYIFVSKREGEIQQVNETTFNYWCSSTFTEIVGRRVHPHLLRSTRATHLVTVQGKDINSARNLLGHESSQTTEIYVVRDESESLGDCF